MTIRLFYDNNLNAVIS